MNILLIATGILFLICIILGAVRGFVKIIASLAATIVIIVFVAYFTPYVSEGIQKAVPLESIVQKNFMKTLAEKIESSNVELPREQQIEMIEQADMPKLFRDLLLENNNNEIYNVLGVRTFGEYVVRYLAKMISDIIAFLLVLFVTTIVVRSIVHALGWINKIPVLGGLNRIAGGVLGMGTGLIILWVFFIVITLLYDTSIAKQCFQDIYNSQLLAFLYENNVLMNTIMRFQ